jgi:ClpP class serine protease
MSQADGPQGEDFPRGRRLPPQTPLFWVGQKDRYLRQLLISDLEARTGRSLIVYFSDCEANAPIDQADDEHFLELIYDVPSGAPVDLLLETNGGFSDATEKVVTVLRRNISDLRVIVPKRAKSNGTLLALTGKQIVMGPASELGPIEPHIVLETGNAPAQFIVEASKAGQGVDPIMAQIAEHAIMQTQTLATKLLETGMLQGKSKPEIDEVVKRLSTRDHYHSHGSVIDADEAAELGLNVLSLSLEDELWRWFWLLRCAYEFDLVNQGLVKIFEGRRVSNLVAALET